MDTNRRDLLRTVGLVAGVGLAGCSDSQSTPTASESTATPTATDAPSQGTEQTLELSASVAASAQLNVYRVRVHDAVALGYAGNPSKGAALAKETLEAFEASETEYGAHEFLEATSESVYEGFEHELEAVQQSLAAGEVEAAAEAATQAGWNVQSAQLGRLTKGAAAAYDIQFFAALAADAAALARAGKLGAARTVAHEASEAFENAPSHDALEAATHEAYEALEHGLEDAASAAEAGNATEAETQAMAAYDAAVEGSYSLTVEEAAAAGEFALYQAQGFDAAMLAGLGGPGDDYAHATTLAVYRARAYDAARVAARGTTDVAATMAGDIYAHFETARAHEGLEAANHDAYEGFEAGLESLETAIANGNSAGVDSALATIDTNLVAGIEALATANAAVLESVHFDARLDDALAFYATGQNTTAASIMADLYERFETDELGFHEAFEEYDHEAYEAFESHLETLETAFTNTDDSSVDSASQSFTEATRAFRANAGGAVAAAATGAGMVATAFDAAAAASSDGLTRATATLSGAFERFEADEGGFHEALEAANHDLYEGYEADFAALQQAANDDGDVYAQATAFFATALDANYAVVAAAGGDFLPAANATLSSVMATFEEARAHELIEEVTHDLYEGFEADLNAAIEASTAAEMESTLDAYLDTAVRAQFALVGAADAAPV